MAAAVKKVCIVIPVYKQFSNLTENEINSIKQCFKILFRYDVFFVVSDTLECKEYLELSKKYGVSAFVKSFNSSYFKDVEGYSRLLLSTRFYKSFRDFEYMLIYQTDAWVFRDELTNWCDKGYDYIGAPWFGTAKKGTDYTFIGVGNGGFSLRRINSFIRVLHSFSYLESPRYIFKERLKTCRSLIDYARASVAFIFYSTIRNNSFYLFNDFVDEEDAFWGSIIPKKKSWYIVAPFEDALRFSFEVKPSYLFGLNNNQLPMGCHAWERYELDFWKRYMQIPN